MAVPSETAVPPAGLAVSLNRALRTYQWVKNVLLFVPMLMAHRVGEVELWAAAALGFVAFSLVASSAATSSTTSPTGRRSGCTRRSGTGRSPRAHSRRRSATSSRRCCSSARSGWRGRRCRRRSCGRSASTSSRRSRTRSR